MWLLMGAIVGLLLGMTGGGGSLVAVPLLVYGMGMSAQQAVGLSLAAVGSTAAWGALRRYREGLLDVRVGLAFSLCGVCGTPIGAFISRQLPGTVLLSLFSMLMLIVAVRMWIRARQPSDAEVEGLAFAEERAFQPPASCRYEPSGNLRLTSRCVMVLGGIGFLVGILSGLFGVGGGFIIVPALVLLTGMPILRAVATSLLVVGFVGISGFVSYRLDGAAVPLGPVIPFALGGIGGLELGAAIASRLETRHLQQAFSVVIVLLGIFILVKNLQGL